MGRRSCTRKQTANVSAAASLQGLKSRRRRNLFRETVLMSALRATSGSSQKIKTAINTVTMIDVNNLSSM